MFLPLIKITGVKKFLTSKKFKNGCEYFYRWRLSNRRCEEWN